MWLQNRLVVGSIYPHSRIWNIYLNLYFHFFALVWRQSAVLSSATQHAIHPDFGTKWEMECLYTRFPLPTLPCAGLLGTFSSIIKYSIPGEVEVNKIYEDVANDQQLYEFTNFIVWSTKTILLLFLLLLIDISGFYPPFLARGSILMHCHSIYEYINCQV